MDVINAQLDRAPAAACAGGTAAPAAGGCADAGELLLRLSWLPPLPQAALKALQALQDDDLDLRACAEPLARDAALAACTLRLANSPLYGRQGRVAQVHDAISLLGRRTVANLVATMMVSSQLTPAQVPGFDFKGFWRHAVSTALAAQALARRLGQDEPAAFLAGLLHDVGRLAMAVLWPQAMVQALAVRERGEMALGQAELSLMGIGHAELGRQLALHWRLPQAVACAIGQHHDAFDTAAPISTLGQTLHLADSLVRVLDVADPERQASARLAAPAAAYVAAQGPRLLPVLNEIQSGVAAISHAMGLKG